MMPGVAYARTTGARPGYTHRADVMIRLPALLLAGCVVSTGLILVGRGSTSSDSPLFGRSSPTTEIKTGAQAREIAEPLLGSTQRPPEAASSDNAGDPRLPDVRLTGIVTEPDQRIAIFAVNGTKSVVLSEGEALNDWRIDSISPQKVSLSGPAGTMTLKPKPDANLVRPVPPAAPPAGQPQPDVPPRLPIGVSNGSPRQSVRRSNQRLRRSSPPGRHPPPFRRKALTLTATTRTTGNLAKSITVITRIMRPTATTTHCRITPTAFP